MSEAVVALFNIHSVAVEPLPPSLALATIYIIVVAAGHNRRLIIDDIRTLIIIEDAADVYEAVVELWIYQLIRIGLYQGLLGFRVHFLGKTTNGQIFIRRRTF